MEQTRLGMQTRFNIIGNKEKQEPKLLLAASRVLKIAVHAELDMNTNLGGSRLCQKPFLAEFP
jgi:hypothetical protein